MSQSTSASSSTFTDIIQQIQTDILKNKYENQQTCEEVVRYHKKWSHEQKRILAELVQQYGSDFTYFKKFLPFKTRKQIQRGYQIHAGQQQRLHRIMQKKERKNRFDIDILGDHQDIQNKIKN